MSAEIDSTSAPEPHKLSGASSAATTSGQKLSIFAAKSGFVIPKNKLSGSLVPIFRGAKKHGVTGSINEESSKQIERRSKWGPDLTQDATVRRGKALALQIRVDQITKQLESEKLEVGDTQNFPLGAENSDQNKSGSQINSKKSEMLELEKREAIGEILKLDPSYKPPRGFKPLLKEASIPLPVQEYPGYNFVGLIYGPEGDNQKQLEKETAAKIRIHGTKADTGERGEIKPGTDIQCSYKEMYVNISADSYEKVDAAMSIIELLITSVTGNLAAGSTPSISVSRDSPNLLCQSQEGHPSHADSVSLENQAVLQPVAITQMHGDNFQYSTPWFSVVPSNTPVFASSGSVAPPNPLGLARTPQFPSQTSNTVPSFGAQPGIAIGFQPIIPNHHVSVQALPPRQILHYPHLTQASPLGHGGPPRNASIISVQNLPTPTNASLSFPVTLSQPTPVGQLQNSVSSLHLPISGVSPLPIPNQPITHHGVPSGQNEALVTVKTSIGPSNMGSMAPPGRPASLHQQPDVALRPLQSNMSMMPRSASFPPYQVGISLGPLSSLRPMSVPIPAPTPSSVNHLSGPVSFPSSGISPSLPLPQQAGIPNSASRVSPYHTHVKPSVMVPSKSGNFTFQSHPPNADYSQVVSGPNSQAGATQEPPSGPRPPPFGFTAPDQAPQIFPRTQFPAQVDQTILFGGRSGSISNSIPAPRHTTFPYGGQPAPRSPVPQMGMKNLISAPQRPNLTSAVAQRGMPIRQSYPVHMARPDIPIPLNHKFVNNPFVASGKPPYSADQIYDPFSPTSAPPLQKGNPGK
ncbi:unnamed protein product [Sphenostylis stenocarpa]|uniref:KHDC4/BBP-like KH-domain type I domain-containing protein n=1 Tax=Sphenostylis stenocarpa TaxID=92480 RepID=A0AA86RVU2_9FABA|nr:unnamed protein product [Sphenostylis stenocarpa]